MKIYAILIICFGLFLKSSAQGPRCPRRVTEGFGICAFTCDPRARDCGPGRICCRTGCGGTTCVNVRGGGGNPRIPWWCPPGSPRIRCFVNPCQVMRCPAVPWARCRPSNPCEPACSGAFFVGRQRVPQWICNRPRRGQF